MYGTLYSDEFDASLEAQSRRPKPATTEPGWFTGFGKSVSEAPQNAWYSSLSDLSETKDAVLRTWQMQDNTSMKLPNYKATIVEPIGRNEQAKIYREKAAQHLPDPATVGKAGQLAHGVTSALIKAGVYSLTDAATLGIGGPALFGADMGMGRTLELTDKGVDPATALESGAVTGALNAAGMKLPAALGKTRLQSVAAGAGANAAMAVGENAAIHTILQHADYEKIAAQYQPFDAENMIVSGLLGGAFGAAFHKAPGRSLTADEHAAVLTMHEIGVRDGDALTPVGDPVAANQAREAQLTARQQIDSGEPVSVDVQADPVQVAGVVSAVAERNASIQAESKSHNMDEVAFRDLPISAKDDIALALFTHEIDSVEPKFMIAWEDSGRPLDDYDVAGISNALDESNFSFIHESISPSSIQNVGRLVSNKLVNDYVKMLDESQPPPIIIARDASGNARIIEGGHRLKAAQISGSQTINAIDISHLLSAENNRIFPSIHSGGSIIDRVKSAISDFLPGPAPPETRFSPETPEQAKALEYFQRNPDAIIPIEGANGDEHMHIQQLFQESQDIIDTAQKDFAGFQAAIECAMRSA